MQLLQSYRQHITDVSQDRHLESMLQLENVFIAADSRPILFCQTDGMDQAKWAIPRYYPRGSQVQRISILESKCCTLNDYEPSPVNYRTWYIAWMYTIKMDILWISTYPISEEGGIPRWVYQNQSRGSSLFCLSRDCCSGYPEPSLGLEIWSESGFVGFEGSVFIFQV